jgi:hypothetical protein
LANLVSWALTCFTCRCTCAANAEVVVQTFGRSDTTLWVYALSSRRVTHATCTVHHIGVTRVRGAGAIVAVVTGEAVVISFASLGVYTLELFEGALAALTVEVFAEGGFVGADGAHTAETFETTHFLASRGTRACVDALATSVIAFTAFAAIQTAIVRHGFDTRVVFANEAA